MPTAAQIDELPTIAVLADDEPLREAIVFSLAAAGYPVRPYAGAEEMFAAAGLGDVGCFIIDQRPGMDALSVIERLDGLGLDSRAVVIATRPSAPLRQACWQSGVPIVEKPILGDTLNACIEGLLAVRRPRA